MDWSNKGTSAAGNHDRKTILLVDDDRAVLNWLEEVLRRCQYTVIATDDASEALAEIRAGVCVDLVITECRMRGAGDLEMLKNLRQTRPAMPAIILTGHGTVDSYLQASSLGMTSYLQKPFRTRELIRIVADALGDRAEELLPLSLPAGAAGENPPRSLIHGSKGGDACTIGRR
jgi:two-component system, NtrC family, response regulator GlrR